MVNTKKPKVTIVVSGGMIQDVYTTSETDMDVDILDFDDNGSQSDEERAELDKHFSSVQSGQRHIY
jgi:tRNA-binding EMAP/Myf-like protein